MRAVVISNSMLRSLHDCSTQAYLRTKGFSTSSREGERLMAGKAAAFAFQYWREGHDPDMCVRAFQIQYKKYSDEYLLESNKYHVDNLSRILSVFFAANPIVAMEWEVVETEKQLEFEVYNDGATRYIVSDKSDAILRMKDTGDLYSAEDKTTGSYLVDDYLLNYALDSQITTHVAACRASGRDVKGVLLQVVQFNKLPDPLATTKTSKPVSCRVSGHGYQRDCWTQHVKWQRYLLTRTPAQLDTWIANTIPYLVRYGKLCEQLSVDGIPQEGIFGVCGKCEFLRFCLSQRQNFDSLVKRQREEGILYSGLYEDIQSTS